MTLQIKEQVKKVMPKIPVGLQEAVVLLVNPDTRQRPTTLVLSRIKYFWWGSLIIGVYFISKENITTYWFIRVILLVFRNILQWPCRPSIAISWRNTLQGSKRKGSVFPNNSDWSLPTHTTSKFSDYRHDVFNDILPYSFSIKKNTCYNSL